MKIDLLRQHIRSTLDIDPERYSAKISEDRINSFTYALAGILHMFRYGKNVRIQGTAAVLVTLVAAWLKLSPVEISLLILVIGINLLAEFMNTAVEAAVNLASTERHPMGQLAKDVAAGAVLLSSIMAALIALLLLAPPLWERLS
jgi:diacylglycerol kinase